MINRIISRSLTGLLLVPGTLFESPGTLRVSWLDAGDRLEEGLAHIIAALHQSGV